MLSVYSGAVQERDFYAAATVGLPSNQPQMCQNCTPPANIAQAIKPNTKQAAESASDTNVTERRRRFVFAENCGSIPSGDSMASPIAEASALCLNLPNERTNAQ